MVFAPADAFVGERVSPTFAQAEHLKRLLLARKYPLACEGEIGFLTKIPAAIYRHFGIQAPVVKPRLLPYPSLGTLFKGREGFMETLRAELEKKSPTVIRGAQAIHGMGGVGKTRAAVEFAYAHEADYSALLFVTADSPEMLQRNLAGLAGPLVLDLPEQNATETAVQVNAVIQWLRLNPDWLLIIDNVDSKESKHAVTELIKQIPQGHVLITSRLDDWPTGFFSLALDVLDEPNSIRLLLNHTEGKRHITAEDEMLAGKIARELDGLCLALEQAAAYIRKNRCGFADYLAAWERASVQLHKEYVEKGIDDYHQEGGLPRSLLVTYETSISQLAAAAQELFRILSWLAPEPLPLKHLDNLSALPSRNQSGSDRRGCGWFLRRWLAFFRPNHSPSLGHHPGARQHLNALTDLHLANLNPADQTLSVHRLLQEISRQQQTEGRPLALLTALKWIDDEMPFETYDVLTWPVAIPLAPHANALAQFAATRDIPSPTIRLLNQVALLFQKQANFRAAESLFRQCLKIDMKHLCENDPVVATHLNNLSQLLQATNRSAEAEPLIRRALAIDEASFGPDHPLVAIRLSNLALLLQATNRLSEAEEPLRRVVEMLEKASGKNHPDVATALNNLALFLQSTSRITEAEPLMRRALAIDETKFGPDHPDVATDLNNLAQLFQATNRINEAEPLMRRALAIDEASFGPDHPDVATDLNNLAQLLKVTNRIADAEPLMRRALAIDEASFGLDHPKVATRLNNLARLLQDTNRLPDAEPLFRRVVKIFEDSHGPDHPNSIGVRQNLEILLQQMQQ